VVTDDYNMETFIGVVLSQESLYGVDDDAVFVIGRIEHKEIVLVGLTHGAELSLQIGRERRNGFLPQHRYQGKEQDVCTRCCQ
jgi:hypothetical protein